MDYDFKWIRRNMSLTNISEDCENIITISNSEDLAIDFHKYATNFFDAAECVIHYVLDEAAEKRDIAKLDLWYFATIYLYRQGLELLLKANLFRIKISNIGWKDIVSEISHDLRQGLHKLLELIRVPTENNENIEWLMNYFSDISRIDRESDIFRYPFGNNLQVLFDKQTHISLMATHENMNKAFNILKDIFNTGAFPEQEYEYEVYPPKLIIEGGHYYQQSVVGYKYSKQAFYPYNSSYVEVGNFLRDTLLEGNRDELFMPMCYIYRNAVELGLKRLIFEDSNLETSKALKIMQRKKHSILGLWNSIADEIKWYANVPDDDTTLEDTLQYIRAFHNFDQNSDLFRYPCNKKMEVYFIESKDFDIENVSSCFQELCNFLDAVDSMLSEAKNYKAEMASYYSDDD